MMRITLNLPEDLVKNTVRLSKSKTVAEAIITALKDYVRRKSVERIIGMEGNLRFADNWEVARHKR